MKKWIALCLAVLLCLALASCGSDGKTSSVSTSSSVAVGDICYFGAYEQDNDLTNGKEPIEWLVLDVQGDKALLLSKYALDAKPYNTTYADVTWETCTLRKWLNDDFLKTAFSEDEQKAILTTEVDNSANDYPSQADIFASVIYDKSLINNRILVADDIGTVFLGTYQWFIKAFDSAGELRWENRIGNAIQGMRYDAARKWLIIGSQDRNVYVLDATNGDILAVYPVKGVVNDIDYDEETGRLLVSTKVGETTANLQILDITNGTELNTYKLKRSTVSAQFSKDRNYCYYSYKHKILKADFESTDGQPNIIGEVSLINRVASIAVVPTTGDVYAIDEGSNLYRFDENLNELFSVTLDSQGNGTSVGVSDDGRWVAAGTKLGDIYIVDSDGKIHFTTRFEDREYQDITTSRYFDVTQVYFSGNTGYIVARSPELFKFSTRSLGDEGYIEKKTDGGKNTQDKVFLLNYAEANKYLSAADDSQYNTKSRAVPTTYAVQNGAYISRFVTENGWVHTTEWWLRSPGSQIKRAALLYTMDTLSNATVDSDYGTVRPALWVKTSAVATKPALKNQDAAVGTTYTFGAYDLNKNTADGKELIDWIVLDVADDGALTLISKYALDIKPYNTERVDVTWETCSLRKWLNEDFYDAAFSAKEKAKIKAVHLINEDHPAYSTEGGNDTDDKVWLLSINEVTDYFSNDKVYSLFTDDDSRKCMWSKYGSETCYWWLRSPGEVSINAACVAYNGYVSVNGSRVDYNYEICIRPVIVIKP